MSASGKVSIVFGGARGIGEACAARLLNEGAKVCIADVQADLGAATCKKLEVTYPGSVIFVSCDITDDKQIEDVFSAASEKFGSVEICVNTAAILDEVNWKRSVQVNLVGSMSVTYIAQQRMGTQNGNKGGHVILLSSIAGVVHPMPYIPCYVTTKTALVGFVRSVGVEEGLKVDGVRVNAILPQGVLDSLDMADACTLSQRYPQVQAKFKAFVKVSENNGITTTMVADAMMKLVEEKELNGATLLFTKDGIKAFDESERSQKISEMLYVNESIE